MIARQIKLGMLKLTFKRDQRTSNIVIIFVSCEENGYYRVVSEGRLSFDCLALEL